VTDPRGARRWRVYHPGLCGEPEALVRVSPEESHHLRRVLRLQPGEPLSLFDGRGSEWSAVIESLASDSTTVRLVAPLETRIEPTVSVTLFQALCRNDRMEWVIQKATELGIGAIHPWVSRRSEVRPPTASRVARWRKIAVEACKQSGRRKVPLIELCTDLPDGVQGLMLHPGAGGRPLGDCVDGLDHAEPALAVGPEGGFCDEEIARWTGRGWALAHLGPRTLRTETAGIAALAILLHRLGDLGSTADLT